MQFVEQWSINSLIVDTSKDKTFILLSLDFFFTNKAKNSEKKAGKKKKKHLENREKFKY